MSTNFRLVLKEPSAREVFTFGLWSREKSGRGNEEEENMAKPSETRNRAQKRGRL